MKVLLRIRGDIAQYPGGDHAQLLQTRQLLEQLGFECILSPGLAPMPPGIDIVHLFNTTRIHETYLQFREAKRRGVRVVLTPIWHSMRAMRRFYSMLYKLPLFPIWGYMAAKELYYARRSRQPIFADATLRYRRLQREVIDGADIVLPNSQAEIETMRRELRVDAQTAPVTPPFFYTAPWDQQSGAGASRMDVVCAGRIEPRKNQLTIIRAFKSLRRTTHRLLLYGCMSPAHPDYAQAVRRELEPGWVEYRGHVRPEELASAYRKAQGAILGSFFETCGFSALEAIGCGVQVCISDSPYTREFFGGHATYCDPFSLGSIRAALESVLARPAPDSNGFLDAYSRETALRRMQEAYKGLMHV